MLWSQIVLPVTALGVEVDPPVYGVLKQLVRDGFVAIDSASVANGSKFSISASGRAFLMRMRNEYGPD